VTCPDNGNADEVSLALAKRGEPDAFADLYRRHKQLVYRRCLQMLHDENKAEDATQDVFLKVWSHLGQFDGRSTFSTWLYRITTNHVLDSLRKTPPTFLYLDDVDTEFEIPDPRDTHAHVQLSQVLEKVRPQDEQILGLWLDGRRTEEIARATGTGVGNVKYRIHRTKNALREALA